MTEAWTLASSAMAQRRAQLISEVVGTAFLLIGIVGSGITAQRISPNIPGLALLLHALAVGLILAAIVSASGKIPGHFNPAVSLFFALRRKLPFSSLPGYFLAQFLGATIGVVLTHAMFGFELWESGQHVRWGPRLWLSEFLSTFGFLIVIHATFAQARQTLALGVGAYMAAAMLSFSSVAFANPAASMARSITNTYAAIRPLDALPYCLAELVAAFVAAAFVTVTSLSEQPEEKS